MNTIESLRDKLRESRRENRELRQLTKRTLRAAQFYPSQTETAIDLLRTLNAKLNQSTK